MPIRSQSTPGAEVSWFAPICNGDDQYLGFHDDDYRSSWKNASEILRKADALGYRNILCPSSYQVGQDTWTFASAVAPLTKQINVLPAIRMGEVHPPMLGRAIATLDHILKGRLTLNVISSNLPGENLSSADRYQRAREVLEILKQGWTQDQIDFKGQFYDLKLDTTEPLKTYQQNGGPLLYFGGYSPPAVDLCAEHCDVYLMWPETKAELQGHIDSLSQKAAGYGRTIDFGLRVHIIVRETEADAIEASRTLMKHVDAKKGDEIRNRALDAKSFGVSKQAAQREKADKDGFVAEQLWTGIGRGRSGCGAAIVGHPEPVLAKIHSYMYLAIRAFIFSVSPTRQE